MCGFYGAFGKICKDITFHDPVLKKVEHRGPDALASCLGQNFYLGFCRLKIRDLEGGNQPFHFQSTVGVVNGEIYNLDHLKSQIGKLGQEFLESNSDTHVLIAYLAIFGIAAIENVEGMFAGVIFNTTTQILHIFRDRTGEKPLFFRKREFIFEVMSENRMLDSSLEHLAYFCDRFLPDHSYSTILKDKSFPQELPPGTFAEMNILDGELHIERYWKWPLRKLISIPPKNRELFSAIENSVIQSLDADVPVATLLSGGVDSAVIATVYKKFYGGDHESFTFSFPDTDNDESISASRIAKQIGLTHSIIQFSYREMAEKLPSVVSCMDTPILDTSCLPVYLLCERISERYKVALGGDGGDELFMGYRIFDFIPYFKALQNFPGAYELLSWIVKVRAKEKLEAGVYLPFNALLERAAVASKISRETNRDFLSLALSYTLACPMEHLLFDKQQEVSKSKISSSSAEKLYRNVILPRIYLTKIDRMSMAHGLEVRSPFLNSNLVELSSRYSIATLYARRDRKFMFRRYLEEQGVQVPSETKRGFSAPFHKIIKWVEEPDWHRELQGIGDKSAHLTWIKAMSGDFNCSLAAWSLYSINDFLTKHCP